jgi:hypothetical protein
LGIYLEIELPDHRITPFSTSEELKDRFLNGCTISSSHQHFVKVAASLNLHHFFIIHILGYSLPGELKWSFYNKTRP